MVPIQGDMDEAQLGFLVGSIELAICLHCHRQIGHRYRLKRWHDLRSLHRSRIVDYGKLTMKCIFADIRRVDCSMLQLRLAGVAREVVMMKVHEGRSV